MQSLNGYNNYNQKNKKNIELIYVCACNYVPPPPNISAHLHDMSLVKFFRNRNSPFERGSTDAQIALILIFYHSNHLLKNLKKKEQKISK
jgi:hypothetical protein